VLGGHRLVVLVGLVGAPPPHAQGCRPTLLGEAQLGDPGLRPTSNDGLPCPMARGVRVDGPFGTGLGIAARPDAHIHCVDRLTTCQRMVGQPLLQRSAAHLANGQGVLEAAPAALLLRLHAQERQRGNSAGRQQRIAQRVSLNAYRSTRIAQLKERVPATPKGRIGRCTKDSKRGKLSGIHAPHSATLRGSPELA